MTPSNDWDEVFDYDRYLDGQPDALGNPATHHGGGSESVNAPTDEPKVIFNEIPNPFDVAAKSFEPPPNYLDNPFQWGKDRLGEHYHLSQLAVMGSVRANRYTAVPSCHDAGKSFIAARIAAIWLDQYPEGEAFVVSTAPTTAQVSAILWREIGKAHKKGGLVGTISMSGYPQWKIGGELVGYGRKPADYSQSAFQGIHARYILIILDEACGIDESLFTSVDALATNVNARVLAIGNPDDPTSHFATICQPGSGWNVVRIDGLRTPNFTQEQVEWLVCPQCQDLGRDRPLLVDIYEEEGIPYTEEWVPDDIRDLLLSPLWVEERLHRWVGIPNEAQTISELANKTSLWLSKVRGLFPTEGSEGIVPLGWVELAFDRWREWDTDGRKPLPANERHVLGVDVADEQGSDATCVAFREGHIIQEIRKHRKADIMETVGHVKAALSSRRGSMAIIDGIGIGSGVVSRLREQHMPVRAFIASASAKEYKDRNGEMGFINLRAAAWWRVRELLDPSQPGGAKIALPPGDVLRGDLTTPKWKVLSGGKILIESKDDIRKRLGRSTDEGDAVVMSLWLGRGTIDTELQGVIPWWGESDGSALPWASDEEMAGLEWLQGSSMLRNS